PPMGPPGLAVTILVGPGAALGLSASLARDAGALERVRTSMRIAVVALGKIGLPLAAQFARSGHEVVGVDVNAELVATVNRDEEPFPGSAHLAEARACHVPHRPPHAAL